MQLKNCAKRMKLALSSSVPGRLPRSMSEQLGGPPTGAKAIHLPPIWILCAGLRAWKVNSRGRRLQRLLDDVAADAHALAIDLGAGLLIDLDRFLD